MKFIVYLDVISITDLRFLSERNQRISLKSINNYVMNVSKPSMIEMIFLVLISVSSDIIYLDIISKSVTDLDFFI